MKSLLVSNSDTVGGAARASYRLHCALRAAAIDSRMLVRRKASADPTVESIRGRGRGIALRISKLQRDAEWGYRSHNVVPSRLASAVAARDPDVVDLHWVGGEAFSIADIGRIRAPVVHTMHDMWGFCGGEHYAPDSSDARWRVGYQAGNRPAGSSGLDLDRWTWQRKRRNWRTPRHVVCPSTWLAECVRGSSLMGSWPVHVIPYALDVDVFRPLDRHDCRRALGLADDARIVLFGADATWPDPRKGFDLFAAALEHLGAGSDAITAVAFGQVEPASQGAAVPLHWVGYASDDRMLAQLYNAADVVVVPSRQDNLAQCGTEAQSCGVPVVAFDTAGFRDVVEHRTTGFLAEPFAPSALAAGIRWVLADRDRHAALSAAARKRASHVWSPAIVASQYRDVYQAAIDATTHRSRS